MNKMLRLFLAGLGWTVSLLLTVNLTVNIFGKDTFFWLFIGVAVGIIFNVAEVATFRYYVQNRKGKHETSATIAVILCTFFFLISVSASIGSLQISYDRAAQESTQYKSTERKLALQDSIVSGLGRTAAAQRKLNHVTKSQRSLLEASEQLRAMDETETRLESVKAAGAGLGNALYRAYSALLGVNAYSIALFFNVLISFLIEATMLFFTGVEDLEPSAAGEKLKANPGFELKQEHVKIEPAIAKSAGNAVGFHFDDLKKNVSDDVPKTFQKNVSETFHGNGKNVSGVVSENRFLNDLRKRDIPSTLTDEIVPGAPQTGDDLKTIFKTSFRGKSDPFILYCFDNWKNVSSGKRISYLNLTKLVNSILPVKQNVSKSYVYRVVRDNRARSAEGGM